MEGGGRCPSIPPPLGRRRLSGGGTEADHRRDRRTAPEHLHREGRLPSPSILTVWEGGGVLQALDTA